MPLVLVAISVMVLLILMTKFTVNGFVALLVVAVGVALCTPIPFFATTAIPLPDIPGILAEGVGRQLDDTLMVIGLGAMICRVMGDEGAAQRIALKMIDRFAMKWVQPLRAADRRPDRHPDRPGLAAAAVREEVAWGMAVILRIALGPATVAVVTAAGVAAPLVAASGVSPELMVLATACGSIAFSHVDDPGFWLFKEYFGPVGHRGPEDPHHRHHRAGDPGSRRCAAAEQPFIH